MGIDLKVSRSSNASPTEFHWDFQHNAGIIIFLAEIKNADTIRIEGSSQDIEISNKDGRAVYAQAKCAIRPDDDTNRSSKFKDALRTLSESAKREDVDELIYISNFSDPLNYSKSVQSFSGENSPNKFDNLSQKCQEKIKRICEENNYNIPYDRLVIWSFYFRGEGSEKYRAVRTAVRDFLDQIECNSHRISVERVLSRWQLAMGQNASESNQSIKIGKSLLIWPIIVWLCEVNQNDAEQHCDDEGQVMEVLAQYGCIISDATDRFPFVTKVMSAYNDFAKAHQGHNRENRISQFVKSAWQQFADDFVIGSADESVKRLVVQIAMRNIVRSRYDIQRIQAEAGL